MDRKLHETLEDLHWRGVEHDAAEPDRLARYRSVEPDTTQLLAVLVRALRARSALELGTSNGYSTRWLTDAVSAIGGRLTSVDTDADRNSQAAANPSTPNSQTGSTSRSQMPPTCLPRRPMSLGSSSSSTRSDSRMRPTGPTSSTYRLPADRSRWTTPCRTRSRCMSSAYWSPTTRA